MERRHRSSSRVLNLIYTLPALLSRICFTHGVNQTQAIITYVPLADFSVSFARSAFVPTIPAGRTGARHLRLDGLHQHEFAALDLEDDGGLAGVALRINADAAGRAVEILGRRQGVADGIAVR